MDTYQKFVKWLEEYKMRVEWQYFDEREADMPILFQGGRLAPLKSNEEVIPIKYLAEKVANMTRAELSAMKTYFRKSKGNFEETKGDIEYDRT